MMKITPMSLPTGDSVIYEYGARLDKEILVDVSRQITMARRLYNDIVAVIRDTVVELQAFTVGKAGQAAVDLQEDIDRLTLDFDAARAIDDKLSMVRIAAERREKWKALGTILKAARKEHHAEIKSRYLSKIGRNSSCATYAKRSSVRAFRWLQSTSDGQQMLRGGAWRALPGEQTLKPPKS